MNASLRFAAVAVLLALAACTPGGIQAGSGVTGGSTVPLTGKVVTIAVNLTNNPPPQFPPPPTIGVVGGYAPAIVNVNVGDQVAFTNTDSFRHTATFIGANLAAYPSAQDAAAPTGPLNQGMAAGGESGATVSQYWTSGTLNAGDSSQKIVIDKAGMYFFGCAYHYPSGMRGEIIAQ